VAALYTAIAYNQPQCVELILSAIGRRDAAKHSFYVSESDEPVLESLEAGELARTLGEVPAFVCLSVCFFARYRLNAKYGIAVFK